MTILSRKVSKSITKGQSLEDKFEARGLGDCSGHYKESPTWVTNPYLHNTINPDSEEFKRMYLSVWSQDGPN